ncbi:hypothetical protein RUND412_005013 [Rhizina undulata]
MSLCGICNDNPSKYKCPTCTLPYCSLTCYKPHKATHTTTTTPSLPPPATAEQAQPPADSTAESTTESPEEDLLAPLLANTQIQAFLRSASLRRHLLSVHNATLEPPADSRRGGGKFRGRGRGRGGRNFVEKPWTAERGERRGLGKLRWLREGGGGANAEVEEFVRAVVGIVDGEGA